MKSGRCVQVRYREATPPNEQLLVRSTVVSIKDNAEKVGGGKPSVQVDITLHKVIPSPSRACLPCPRTCQLVHKQTGMQNLHA